MTNLFSNFEEYAIKFFLWFLENLVEIFVVGYLGSIAVEAWTTGLWQVSVFVAVMAFLYIRLVVYLRRRQKRREER